MSFILDALKKSESERQQQGQSAFASVPVSDGSRRPPAWLWLLVALLLINLVVIVGLLLRPGVSQPLTVNASPTPTAGGEEVGFEDRVRSAIETQPTVRPAPEQTAQVTSQPVIPASEPASTITPTTASSAIASPAVAASAVDVVNELPDIDQLRATGALPLGDLRLDIHVYSENPEDRFVFINMVKHREGSSTSDGLAVREITQDGVILNYRGRDFVLPRQ
ncbi:MAG: general secretion pathway protein GspB [Pseudomonadota bacterium]